METRATKLMATASPRIQALLRGQQQKHASLWKQASSTAEMFTPGDLFRIQAQYSVGHPFFTGSPICPSCQKETLDPFGDHCLICMPDGDVVHRHNDLYKPIIAEARAGMIGLSVETKITIP